MHCLVGIEAYTLKREISCIVTMLTKASNACDGRTQCKEVVHCIVRMKHAQCNALRRIIVHTFRGYAVTAWREGWMYIHVSGSHSGTYDRP
jgi:hypothetical protein